MLKQKRKRINMCPCQVPGSLRHGWIRDQSVCLSTAAALAEPELSAARLLYKQRQEGASLAVADLAESPTNTPDVKDWGELYLDHMAWEWEQRRGCR